MKHKFTYLLLLLPLTVLLNSNLLIGQAADQNGGKGTDIYIQYVIPDIKANYDKPFAAPKYILFRNFDPAFSELLYFYHFQNEPEFKDDFISADFSRSFFENNKITDFEVAVFPLGNVALDAVIQGTSISPLSVIKEMLDSGKRVIIIGRVIFYAASIGNNQELKDFLGKTLALDYLGLQKTSDTFDTQIKYQYYYSKGHIKDPVTLASRKFCNGKLLNSSDGSVICEVPLSQCYHNIDVFKTSDTSVSKEMDHYIKEDTDPVSEKLVGTRSVLNKGKLVLWSIGFENYCQDNDRRFVLISAIRWLMQDAPKQGAILEFYENKLDFGFVKPGDTSTKDAIILNTGIDTLRISKIFLEEWTDPGIYQIVSGGDAVDVEPGGQHLVSIKFSPKDPTEYNDFLNIQSNAANYSGEASIQLAGRGDDTTNVNEDKIQDKINITITPNPITDKALICFKISSSFLKITDLYITDLLGNKIRTYPEFTIRPGKNTLELNSEGLYAGAYFLIARFEEQSFCIPIIIIK
ncbi:MAG: Choice-of-anchor protein [Bacteroidota bacterium]|nr:Choice-of-anchor protein [Bacteroidota bacterium]